MQYFHAADIRQFALDRLDRTNRPADYLPLLVANYEKDDGQRLAALVAKCQEIECFHDVAYGCIRIYRANHTKECQGPL